MVNTIQAQAMINGKNTFFVTRPKDVHFGDGSTLEDKKFGEVEGIEDNEVTKLISEYMNGIKFDEEYLSDTEEDATPDNYLDPELISYIDSLFTSLNDLIVYVPAGSWIRDGNYYTKTINVEELKGTECPIISVVYGSSTDSSVMDTDTISSTLRDILIDTKSVILKSASAITVGFQLILKGVNVPGGMIIQNYNSLLEKINMLGGGVSPVYTELEGRVTELETTVENVKGVQISDKYKSYDGKASDRVAASSYALYMVYKLLEKRFEIKNEVNTVLENQEGEINVITKSGWCRICGYIRIKLITGTPIIVLRNLPIPYGKEINTYLSNGSTSLYVTINNDGIMSVNDGAMDTKYYIEISYPYEEE